MIRRQGESYSEYRPPSEVVIPGESKQELIDRTLHSYSFDVRVTRPDGRSEVRTIVMGAYGATDDDADANLRMQLDFSLHSAGTNTRVYLEKDGKP